MFIKDLPIEIKIKAYELYKKDAKSTEAITDSFERFVEIGTLAWAFPWDKTDEGASFWENINEGNFEEFYNKYPSVTTKRAKRFNKGKLSYRLLPKKALEKVIDVYTRGAHKYSVYKKPDGSIVKGMDISPEEASQYELIETGAHNWRKGQLWTESLESVQRHIEAFRSGEDIDELGTYHLGNAVWGLLSLLEYYDIHPELDDRPHWWKNPRKKMFLDIDGVLAAFEERFLEYFNLDRTDPTDWNDVRFVNRLDELKDNKDFWLSIPSLVDPKDIAYPIAGYCTARSISTDIVKEWLDKNGFPEAPILRVNFGESKVQKLKEAGCDIMVDDSFNNFTELNCNGIMCYLVSRPHNMKYNVGHYRVKNLKEAILKIQNHE